MHPKWCLLALQCYFLIYGGSGSVVGASMAPRLVVEILALTHAACRVLGQDISPALPLCECDVLVSDWW